ncbi:uncharacterized protein MONOS_1294 [Monocercomonoides exilis]|uniref:uncharacterized protein n=1 Tax=Monocercomonoides exilis TaxID=2049356 RepID=UPI003559F11B|nr:hypothetical protein MONOS_1294 [Monocercomonoides exilis]|eukprot:MONOS_1294.1-p1 / transcript=MONOS_1294.1 / gene=MONOS_1294 / organism=Monocercomonoides_exilis_PA203 / gene_product=unspecified product / transcript_product=unspecified product / location=Mono_scaffold00022:80924-82780(+) / protein_length=619 / sequence_SO=supercontig / SO=protein_coding / is_pseudo=false
MIMFFNSIKFVLFFLSTIIYATKSHPFLNQGEISNSISFTSFPSIPSDLGSYALTLHMPSIAEHKTCLKNQNIQIGGRDITPVMFSDAFSDNTQFELSNSSLVLSNLLLELSLMKHIATVDVKSKLEVLTLNISFLASPCSCFELDGGSIHFDNLILSSASIESIKPVVSTKDHGGMVSVSYSNFESLVTDGSTGLIADPFTNSVSFSYCVLKNITHMQNILPSPQWSYNHHSSLVNNVLEHVDNVFYGGIVQGMLGCSFVCTNTTIRRMHRDAVIPRYHSSEAQQQLSESKTFDHATIRESTAPNHGGAIWMVGPGELKLHESKFVKCSVTDDDSQGGAIDVSDRTHNPTLTMTYTIINRCQAKKKGGGYIWNGQGSIERSSCIKCSAEYGGGLYLCEVDWEVTIYLSSFTHCSAVQSGGGCFIEAAYGDKGLVTLNNLSFLLCSSEKDIGGGVYLSKEQGNHPESIIEANRKKRVSFFATEFTHNDAIEKKKGKDVGAADCWEGLLVKESFSNATSLTEGAKVTFETKGGFDDWLSVSTVFSGEFIILLILVIVIGIALLIAVIVVGIACCCWNRKKKKKEAKKEAKRKARLDRDHQEKSEAASDPLISSAVADPM